jgi:hypothetical protein
MWNGSGGGVPGNPLSEAVWASQSHENVDPRGSSGSSILPYRFALQSGANRGFFVRSASSRHPASPLPRRTEHVVREKQERVAPATRARRPELEQDGEGEYGLLVPLEERKRR